MDRMMKLGLLHQQRRGPDSIASLAYIVMSLILTKEEIRDEQQCS
jgi:hypothetical protein